MSKHSERHYINRIGWLRAAVLGANDGIISTASLVIGVSAANVARADVLTAGIAGLVAGAMSMAAGEYVSVSSQADTEKADLEREKKELETDEAYEREELTNIYIERGLEPSLAREVSRQLMAHDALSAHARDELGLSEISSANPIQAAFASAISFSIGALLPLLIVFISPGNLMMQLVGGGSLVCLAVMGGVAAQAGGANIFIGAIRVSVWGAIAMVVTAIIGSLFGSIG